MNVDEFQRHKGIRETAKEKLPELIREKLEDYQLESVYAHDAMKKNGQLLLGVTVVPKGQDMAPCIYVEPYLPPDPAQLSGHEIWEQVAERMAKDFRYALEVIEPDQVKLFDAAWLEEKLVLELVNKEKNLSLLKNNTYKEFMDLAAMLRWEMVCGNRVGSAAISEQVVREWGRSVDELYDIALANCMKKYPARIEPLRNVLDEMSRGLLTDVDSPFYYVGTERGVQGSIAILYPGVLKEIYEKMGEPYYIIPSSINELLALPVGAEDETGYLMDLIHEINSHMLDKTEVLTDALYRYRVETDTLETVFA